MSSLNNLDIIILIVVAISALIALSRGLVKEVLSIIGWVLATFAIIYVLPMVMPFAKNYISNGYIAGAVSALCILILFFIIWIYATAGVVGKIRSSKLNGMDRMLGLFFGIARACLLVILFYILVSWMIPPEKQSETLTESRYFQLAGKFAAPLEEMIPEETLKLIKEKTQGVSEEEIKEEEPEAFEEETNDSDTDELFEKLAQPQIKKALKKKKNLVGIKEGFEGYKESERDNLDRLIENVE